MHICRYSFSVILNFGFRIENNKSLIFVPPKNWKFRTFPRSIKKNWTIKTILKQHSDPFVSIFFFFLLEAFVPFCECVFNRKSCRARHAIGHEVEGRCLKRAVAGISSPSLGRRRTPIREELRRRFNSRSCLSFSPRGSSLFLSFRLRHSDVDALDFTQSRR